MAKLRSHVVLTETLALSEDHHGFWLYDKTRGMNLSMKAKSERDAFVEALTYYQRRLAEVESCLKSLSKSVEDFAAQIPKDLLPYDEENW
jgi:hypothetical protein